MKLIISLAIALLIITLTSCNMNRRNPPRTPTNPTPTDPADPQLIIRLHQLHLKQRGENRPELFINTQLNQAAQKHAEWMAQNNKMSHTGENGSSFWDRMIIEGYNPKTGGENVAYGYSTAEEVVQGWMNSSGHRANILNTTWTEVGYGVAGNNSKYWCTVFAKPQQNNEVRILSAPNDIVQPGPLQKQE